GSGHLFGVDLFGGIDVLVHEGQQPILVLARGVAHRELHCGSLFLVSPGRGCRGDRSRARGPRQSQWLGGGRLTYDATFSSMLHTVHPVKGVHVPRAAIVATARTPIGKAYRGAFNNSPGPTLAAHAISAAVERAGIETADVDDVILGCAMPEGATGFNVARQSALRAGLPVTVPGTAMDRQCASGLIVVATAAKQIVVDKMHETVAGGVESISLVQNEHANTYRNRDPWLVEHVPGVYMPMLHTAENVASRHGISRERQDQMGLQSVQRTLAAQAKGVFDAEIVPITVSTLVKNPDGDGVVEVSKRVTADEG